MRRLTRRGFTLVELLIAIVIFGIVSTAIYGLLVRTQRLSRTQAERSIMQSNIRTGIGLVTSELRELNANALLADIYAMSATAIEYKGMRGLGFVCDIDAGYVRVPRAVWVGFRDPVATRDRVMLFVENDPDLASDDGWIERAITGVTSESCSAGGAGVRLDIAASIPTDTLAMMTLGSPVRTFERMQIGQMTSDGETWLGARSISGGETTLQPVLGPLTPSGVTFSYWTQVAGTSVEALLPLQVRTIRLVLRGITENIVAAGAGTVAWQRASDSLVTDIRLRNAP
ncbi:MAG: PilW family protein [Gemmatimonadales bacterium]